MLKIESPEEHLPPQILEAFVDYVFALVPRKDQREDGVFYVQMSPMNETGLGFAGELTWVTNLVDVAKSGGASRFVHLAQWSR
ncbi:hypothetical protein [Streptomyces sp. NPDC048663]|uniref:hypothetical protein n=1 Tax=Streptomyces sp. NPDC048663 TaxID=3155638 RepID=UPI0034173035